jgi:carbamoyl-phosphate synthase large subunit
VTELSGYIVQEYLGDDSSEFTASCLTDRDDKVRGSIVLHRRLLQGTTVVATAGDFPDVRREAERMAAALRPRGPLNIQMRVHRGMPVCFEMNVRFSGTTPLRARLGFNDVEAVLRHYVLGEPAADLPLITSGHVVRYWNELYVDPQAFEVLAREGRLDPAEHPVRIEDYGARS